MSFSTYHKPLDFVVAGLAAARKGDTEQAAIALHRAINHEGFQLAMTELSNLLEESACSCQDKKEDAEELDELLAEPMSDASASDDHQEATLDLDADEDFDECEDLDDDDDDDFEYVAAASMKRIRRVQDNLKGL